MPLAHSMLGGLLDSGVSAQVAVVLWSLTQSMHSCVPLGFLAQDCKVSAPPCEM